jgi:DNA invertase Pin-like site-specific DNA recombinase
MHTEHEPVTAREAADLARRLYRDAGLPVDQIAHATGASVRQVYRWVRGSSRPLPVFVAALRSLAEQHSLAA